MNKNRKDESEWEISTNESKAEAVRANKDTYKRISKEGQDLNQ
jgi:hypothetical protein